MRRNLRALGINLLLCITSVCIFFGTAELLARLKYTPQKIEYPGNFEYDKEKAFRLKSNFQGLYYDVPFSTNSFGLRNAEISVEKPENTRRVLMVGDSVFFGHRMLDDETSSVFLEQALNQHLSETEKGFSVQVINAATPGNATYQEYYDLERGLQFDPDVIVLQFTLNDVIEHYASWIFKDMGLERSEKENHDYLLGHTNVSSADNLLKQHSAFYLFLKDMYGRVRFWDITGENIVEKAQQEEILTALNMITNPEHPKVLREWDNCLVLMKKMTDLAKERGIPFILIATPLDFQLGHEKQFAHPQRILKKFAKEEGIEFIDLLETLHRLYAESAAGEPVETSEEIDRIIRETDTGTSDPFAEFWAIYFLEYIHPSIKGNELIVSLLKPVVLNALDTTDPS